MAAIDIKTKVQAERLRKLMADVGFRRFLLTLFAGAGIDVPSFQQGSPDVTSFNEGRRALGIEIRDLIESVEPRTRLLLEEERLSWSQQPPQGNPDDEDPYPEFG